MSHMKSMIRQCIVFAHVRHLTMVPSNLHRAVWYLIDQRVWYFERCSWAEKVLDLTMNHLLKICVLLSDKKQWQLTHNGRKQGFPYNLGRTSSSCSRWIPALDACKWKSNDQVMCVVLIGNCNVTIFCWESLHSAQANSKQLRYFLFAIANQKLRINYLKQINWKQRFEKTCPSKT